MGRTRRVTSTAKENDSKSRSRTDVQLCDRRKAGAEGESAQDRSGFGPGGDRSGMVAVVDGYQVCALQGRHDDRHSLIAHASAHPSCVSLHLPYEYSVQGPNVERMRDTILFPNGGGTVRRRDFVGTGDNLSYLEGDSSVNSIRVFSLDLDLHEDKHGFDPTTVTSPSGDCCSMTAPPYAPRRSVAFCDFKVVSQPVVYACQCSVSTTSSCGHFQSRTPCTACALAGIR